MTETPSARKESHGVDPRFTREGVSAEMSDRIKTIAALSNDNRKAALAFVAEVLGMPYGKVKRLYYGEVVNVPAHEADKIRAFCDQAAKIIQARADYDAERRDFLASAGPLMGRLAPPKTRRTLAAPQGNQVSSDTPPEIAARTITGGRGT